MFYKFKNDKIHMPLSFFGMVNSFASVENVFCLCHSESFGLASAGDYHCGGHKLLQRHLSYRVMKCLSLLMLALHAATVVLSSPLC